MITLTSDRNFGYVAELYGTDVQTLNQLNNLKLGPKKLIRAGSSLYIPK